MFTNWVQPAHLDLVGFASPFEPAQLDITCTTVELCWIYSFLIIHSSSWVGSTWFFYQVGLRQSLFPSSGRSPAPFPPFSHSVWDQTFREVRSWGIAHLRRPMRNRTIFPRPTQILMQVESIQPYSFLTQICLNRINSNSCFNRIGVETGHSSVFCPSIGLSRSNQNIFSKKLDCAGSARFFCPKNRFEIVSKRYSHCARRLGCALGTGQWL